LLSVPHYPKEDHKLRATEVKTRVGGNIPNTLQVLAQACSPEDRLIFLSAFAERNSSKRLTDVLSQKGVEFAGVWRDCADNPCSWILQSEQSGSRTIVNYNKYVLFCLANRCVQELSSQELVDSVRTLDNPGGIQWVHFEGRIPDILHTAIPSIRTLLPHATISIEFEKPDRPGLNDLLPLADVVFFSNTYYSHSLHTSVKSFFASIRKINSTATLILTVGDEGAYYCALDEEGYVNAPRVEVVEPTGAGDTFIGGFVWARGKMKRGVAESVVIAVHLASEKVSQEGFEGIWKCWEGIAFHDSIPKL
jgi:ketohexokinase